MPYSVKFPGTFDGLGDYSSASYRRGPGTILSVHV